jgi:PAS domain S-box-containing protein
MLGVIGMKLNQLINKEDYQGVYILVDENDKIISVNGIFASLLGYKVEELINQPFIDLIVPSDKSLYYDITYQVENYKEVTLKMYHKRGTYRFFKLVLHDFGNHNLLLGKDIKRNYISNIYESSSTNHVLTELFKTINSSDIKSLLDINSSSLSLLFDLLPLDLWIKDEFGRYIYCNESFSKHTGHTLTNIYMKDDFSIYNNEIANAFVNSDKEAIESKNRIVYSFQSKVKELLAWTEVTKIPVFNNNKEYLGIIGYSIDITDNKNAELKLLEETQKHQNILNHIEGLVFEIDSNESIVFVNGDMNRKLFANNDQSSHPLEALFHKNDVFNEKIKVALAGKASLFEITIKDIPFIIRLEPYQNKKSISVIGYGKVISDGD